MPAFKYRSVCIESYHFHVPPIQVTSLEIEDKLAPLYERLNIPFGTLEKLSGVGARNFFEPSDTPSRVAGVAGKAALESIGFDRSHIKAVFNCSVTRDFFEPATASLVHRELGIPEDSISMDITNACIGFSNGIVMLSNLIESGVVKAGLLVSGENISRITDATVKKLLENSEISREELLRLLPTFTLGSGAVAMVLCHESLATKSHRILGSAVRSASEFSDLCIGNGDFCYCQPGEINPIMETDSQKLIASAAQLGARTWQDASEVLGWSSDEIDRIICHQVGKQVNGAFYRTMGLPIEKEFTVYQRFGNLISAALPSGLITCADENQINPADKVLLLGFGSGLNAIFTGVVW